jgi:PAS domain S-box-containing protein
MINKGGKLKTISRLRVKAEEIAKNTPSSRPIQLSEVDTLKLLHELEVYQIELEMINDQLRLANKEILLQHKEKEKQAKKLIKANKQIRESEEKFKSIIHSQTEGIGFVNQDEIFEFANKAAIRIFETGTNELIGTNLSDFLKPEDWNNIVQQTSKRKSGKSNSYELHIVTKKGNRKYIHVSATPKFDENHNYLGAYAIFSDITEKTEAEIKLKASEDRFKKLSEHSRVITWEVDSKGLYTYMSQTCKTVLGYQPEEIVGKKYFYDLHPPGERESFKKAAFEGNYSGLLLSFCNQSLSITATSMTGYISVM